MKIVDKRKLATQYDYSRISSLYRDDFGKDFAHFELIDTVLDKLREENILNQPIIDLGCGPGTVSDYLVSKGIDSIVAVDITPEFCQMVQSNHPLMSVICSDMSDYMKTVEAGSIGAIIANFSIIHVPDEELDELLENIKNALVLGGFFVMSCHKGTYKGMELDPYITQKDKRLPIKEQLSTYMNYFTEEELRERITKEGLEIVEMHTFTQQLVPGEIDVPKIWIIATK